MNRTNSERVEKRMESKSFAAVAERGKRGGGGGDGGNLPEANRPCQKSATEKKNLCSLSLPELFQGQQ